MLRQLVRLGVDQATLVLGDRSHQVQEAIEEATLPIAYDWVINEEYATSNNSWSLALAGTALSEGGLLIEGDIVADDAVLARLAAAVPETCASTRQSRSSEVTYHSLRARGQRRA
jgi:choline kinase